MRCNGQNFPVNQSQHIVVASPFGLFSIYQYRNVWLNVKDGFESLKKDFDDKTKGNATALK